MKIDLSSSVFSLSCVFLVQIVLFSSQRIERETLFDSLREKILAAPLLPRGSKFWRYLPKRKWIVLIHIIV